MENLDAAIAEVKAVREHDEALLAAKEAAEEGKPLSQITRSEWIAFNWIEIALTMGDGRTERMFDAITMRTPAEALQAADEWDQTAEERAEFA